MADSPGRQEIPSYHANIVTCNLTVDELVLELRRVDLPHDALLKAAGGKALVHVPAPLPEQVMSYPPIARIILTFTSANSLKDYLNGAVPPVEAARREGRPL